MKFKVTLYRGYGVDSDSVEVEALNEEEALVVASLSAGQFINDDEADSDEEMESMGFTYLDRSEYEATNGWLNTNYAMIELIEE